MGRLSRKDVKVLSLLATTPELKDKLNEYINAEKEANKLWKEFREAVVNGEEVKTVESTEVKRKFKAGDKVRVISVERDVATMTGLSVGDVTEVIAYKDDSPEKYWFISRRPVIVTGGRGHRGYFEESALELVVEEQEKSPNELRAEIIEKAKEFVDECRNEKMIVRVDSRHYSVDVSFVVNADRRTVVALLRGVSTDLVRVKGIAKCNPDDIFNEHIGKAIALGRALRKDVSEFKNAVQPNEIVIDMKIRRETDGSVFNAVHLCPCNGSYTILDDTNAKY